LAPIQSRNGKAISHFWRENSNKKDELTEQKNIFRCLGASRLGRLKGDNAERFLLCRKLMVFMAELPLESC